jgi:outer membrane protein
MSMKIRTIWITLALLAAAAVPGAAWAVGIEAAVGGWNQTPSGELSYQSADNLSLKSNLGFGDRSRVTGRVKLEAPFLAGVYLMATPMEFRGTGSKADDFTFGGQTFQADVPVTSRLSLDHYDLGLYVGLPFIRTATFDAVNFEVGLDARFIDFKAELTQLSTGIHESVNRFIVVPMAYAGLQLKPVRWFVAEGEVRGIAWGHSHYYDLIARAKVKPFGPVFVAGGYRYEKFRIDVSDIRAEGDFGGPFAEVGVDF